MNSMPEGTLRDTWESGVWRWSEEGRLPNKATDSALEPRNGQDVVREVAGQVRRDLKPYVLGFDFIKACSPYHTTSVCYGPMGTFRASLN